MTVSLDAETLLMLRDSVARFREGHYSFEQRRAWLDSDAGYSTAAWREYASLGLLSLALPERHGGVEGDPRALAAVMEYLGEALALEPVFASTVLCGRLLSRAAHPGAQEWLEGIGSGDLVFSLAHAESEQDPAPGQVQTAWSDGRVTGTKLMVLHGDIADRLIVSARDERDGGLALCVIDTAAPGIATTRYRLIDGRSAASFAFAAVASKRLGFNDGADESLARVLTDARLALCSETYGAVRALNAITTEYLKTRRQFGKPIGANQALQHRMVELYILQEELAAVIAAAHRACSDVPSVGVRAVSAAAAHAATTARQTAHEAVQMHGGMGITSELPVSHYFKRLMVTARLLGDRDQHLARFAAEQDKA